MPATTYDVYCGIDVGKLSHHAIALRPDGSRILSQELPQDETRIRELIVELAAHPTSPIGRRQRQPTKGKTMTDNFSDIKTYSIYRYNVPFDGTFTVETGILETIDKPRHDWSGPGDHDPIEHQH